MKRRLKNMQRNKYYIRFIKLGSFIAQHKVLYYILNLTWGLPMTIVGYLLMIFLRILGLGKLQWLGYTLMFVFKKPKGWGFSLGTVIFVGLSESRRMEEVYEKRKFYCHEYGHTVQNAILGPLTIFLVYIPSAIRFWYRERKIRKHNKLPSPRPPFVMSEYDAVWFEGSATDIGLNHYDYLNEKYPYWS